MKQLAKTPKEALGIERIEERRQLLVPFVK
jgi:hypothetical protein